MADIELVIKIDEEIKAVIDKNGTNENVTETLWQAVKNGIPLPKGHGRLIDADVLKRSWNGIETSVGYRKVIDLQVIDNATPIIEADKGE